MLVDPKGAPLASDGAVKAKLARAQEVVEGMLAHADTLKVTPGEFPEMLANLYASWLSTLTPEDFKRMVPALAQTINVVTEQVMHLKAGELRIRQQLVAANEQGKPS